MKNNQEKELKFYTKVKLNNIVLYFDTFEKVSMFATLFFKANKNNEFIEFARSNEKEFSLNT